MIFGAENGYEGGGASQAPYMEMKCKSMRGPVRIMRERRGEAQSWCEEKMSVRLADRF